MSGGSGRAGLAARSVRHASKDSSAAPATLPCGVASPWLLSVQLGRGAECHRLQVTPASRRIRSLLAVPSLVRLHLLAAQGDPRARVTRACVRLSVLYSRSQVVQGRQLGPRPRLRAGRATAALCLSAPISLSALCMFLLACRFCTSGMLWRLRQVMMWPRARHCTSHAKRASAAVQRERLECMHRALRVGRCGSGLNFLLSAPLASATSQVFALWCARRFLLAARAHRQW